MTNNHYVSKYLYFFRENKKDDWLFRWQIETVNCSRIYFKANDDIFRLPLSLLHSILFIFCFFVSFCWLYLPLTTAIHTPYSLILIFLKYSSIIMKRALEKSIFYFSYFCGFRLIYFTSFFSCWIYLCSSTIHLSCFFFSFFSFVLFHTLALGITLVKEHHRQFILRKSIQLI